MLRDHVLDHPSILGQSVARLYLRIGRDLLLQQKNQAESYCEYDSAQALQTKRSFLEILLFLENAISLPESHRDGPLPHQKWGQVGPLLLEDLIAIIIIIK